MYKAAVLGNYDSIYAFAALGLDVICAETAEEAIAFLRQCGQLGYALIYITEDLLLNEQISKAALTGTMPVIIPIPSLKGEAGIGMARIRKMLEQAVGSDIIFND